MAVLVTLPEAVEQRLRAKAKAEGTSVEALAARELASLVDAESWLDASYHAECEADQSPDVSLEAVRRVLSKIPGSMVGDFRAERDE